MKKFNKQILLDLERKSKKIRLSDKDDTKEFTSLLIDLQNFLKTLSLSIDKELEKYAYCNNCKNYHDTGDFQKLIMEIKDDDPDYGYYYDVCPICKSKVLVEKKLLDKK